MGVEMTFDEGLVTKIEPWGVRELWLRFAHGSESRDTVVMGRYRDGALRATAWLHGRELVDELAIYAEVRLSSGLTLLSGSGTARSLRSAPRARVLMAPEPTIAFLTSAPNARNQVGLAAMDGAFLATKAVDQAAGIDISPVDGTLAYQGRAYGAGGPWKVRLMDPYTRVERTIVEPGVGDFRSELWPRFSADGEWIYFEGFKDFRTSDLWRVRVDGSGVERILESGTMNGGGRVGSPAPSHDGQRVAYHGDGTLHILDLMTGRATSLSVLGSYFRWSPDDKWIAYQAPSNRLRIVRPDGTDDRELVPGLGVFQGFDWTSEGDFIIAAIDGSVAARINLTTGEVEELSELGTVRSLSLTP